MCKRVLLIFKNTYNQDIIMKIFEKYKYEICINPYYNLSNFSKDYLTYSSNSSCDCDNFISFLRDYNDNNFRKYIKNENVAEMKRAKKIHTLKNRKDFEEIYVKYSKKFNSFDNERQQLFKKSFDFNKSERMKIDNLNLSEKELDEFEYNLYLNIKKIDDEIINSNQYKLYNKNQVRFLRKNSYIHISKQYSYQKYLKYNKLTVNNLYRKMNRFKLILNELFQEISEFYIYSFKDTCDPLEINHTLTTKYNELNLDTLLFLKYDTLLKITFNE